MTATSESLKTQREVARLSVDAFVRSVAVNRGRPVCFLLGAGSSISSGMPSAQRCIWEWKRDIFVTQNPLLRESVGELSLPGTRQRIQRWLDQRGNYPAAGSPEEYSFYARECYPTGQDRRRFFRLTLPKQTRTQAIDFFHFSPKLKSSGQFGPRTLTD